MENVNLEMIRGDDDGWTFEVLEELPTLELTFTYISNQTKAALSSSQAKQAKSRPKAT